MLFLKYQSYKTDYEMIFDLSSRDILHSKAELTWLRQDFQMLRKYNCTRNRAK